MRVLMVGLTSTREAWKRTRVLMVGLTLTRKAWRGMRVLMVGLTSQSVKRGEECVS